MEFAQTRDQSSKDENIINFRVALSTLSSVSFWANTYSLVLGFSADFFYIKYVYRKSNREPGGGNYRDGRGMGGGGCNAPF